MKTLSDYKSDYKKRKTQKGRQNVMNRAMLNLSPKDQWRFLRWQINLNKLPEY